MKKTTEVARRTRAAAERRAGTARIARLGSAVAIGLAKKYGWFDPIPAILGSKLATVAVGAGAISYMAGRGKVAEATEGVAESALIVALYQGSSGGFAAISGDDSAPQRRLPRRRDSAEVAEQLRALSERAREAAHVAGEDDEDDEDDYAD